MDRYHRRCPRRRRHSTRGRQHEIDRFQTGTLLSPSTTGPPIRPVEHLKPLYRAGVARQTRPLAGDRPEHIVGDRPVHRGHRRVDHHLAGPEPGDRRTVLCRLVRLPDQRLPELTVIPSDDPRGHPRHLPAARRPGRHQHRHGQFRPQPVRACRRDSHFRQRRAPSKTTLATSANLGANGNFVLQNASGFTGATWTFECWYNATAWNAGGGWFYWQNPFGAEIVIQINGSGASATVQAVQVDASSNQLSYQTNTAIPADGNWHHFAVTRTGTTTMAIYLDGQPMAVTALSTANAAAIPAQNVVVGTASPGFGDLASP